MSAREIQRYRKTSFGIILSVLVSVPIVYLLSISVPESTASSTEIPKYRISFGIPSSGYHVCCMWISHSAFGALSALLLMAPAPTKMPRRLRSRHRVKCSDSGNNTFRGLKWPERSTTLFIVLKGPKDTWKEMEGLKRRWGDLKVFSECHLTTRRTEWMSDTCCTSEQISHDLKLHHLSFFPSALC